MDWIWHQTISLWNCDDPCFEKMLELIGAWKDDWGFFYIISIASPEHLVVEHYKRVDAEMFLQPHAKLERTFIYLEARERVIWSWRQANFGLWNQSKNKLQWKHSIHDKPWILCRSEGGCFWTGNDHTRAHAWHMAAFTRRPIEVVFLKRIPEEREALEESDDSAESEEAEESEASGSLESMQGEDDSLPRWEYAAGGEWRQFPEDVSDSVEAAWLMHMQNILPNVIYDVGRYSYLIDFATMRQVNTQTGRTRDVRRHVVTAASLQDRLARATAQITAMEQELFEHRNDAALARSFCEQEQHRLAGVISDKDKRIREQADEIASLSTTVSAVRTAKETSCKEAYQEAEWWRTMSLSSISAQGGGVKTRDAPELAKQLQDRLRHHLCPSGAVHAVCKVASSITIERVQRVINTATWRMYCSQKQRIASRLSGSSCFDITNGWQEVRSLRASLDYVILDASVNEVLLLHGTPPDSAQQILEQGFDDRMANREMYGPGVYFTTDLCKAIQYSKPDPVGKRCFLLSRVVLGNPYMAPRQMHRVKRPPEGPDGQPHDSIVARRGIPNGTPNNQVHLEFVVRDTQAYPECLLWFTVPGS
eukprot:TRINITY_DN31633_c0_g1_i1.p1 TRINITY_DN31633_c0_g1~~TRINITY_DN31633_c0_g1_i1.p1  ORF type:complete len:593 (-),score=40.33 TRINITY_DN31633_c0_g1_i1:259-2037(-)